MTEPYATIRYESSPDRVATITLDRPEVLNAFDRRMCEEVKDAWARIKADPEVNAVVLRAAGDRAFCAGLDVKQSYGQPDDVWNHEDPGELLSPKWQKVWKPVVCAVHGHVHGGGVLLRQRVGRRDLLRGRDLLRLARHQRNGLGAGADRLDATHRSRARRCASRCPVTTSASPRIPRCGSGS